MLNSMRSIIQNNESSKMSSFTLKRMHKSHRSHSVDLTAFKEDLSLIYDKDVIMMDRQGERQLQSQVHSPIPSNERAANAE